MDIWERSPAARGGQKRTDQSGRVFREKQGDQGGESAWSDDGGGAGGRVFAVPLDVKGERKQRVSFWT